MDIEVRFEPDEEATPLRGGRPLLTWGDHPVHGNGWTLSYLDDPTSEAPGVEEHFIPGDLLDVDEALSAAGRWLAICRGE